MNIYKYEFKMYMRSIFIWVFSILGLLLMFMSLFPTFAKDAAMMDAIMQNYPEELLKAFGMAGGLSLSSVGGYLVFVFAFVQLLLAIQASNYGFSFLSIEERELTADFLMSKPVSRNKILFSKFMAAYSALLLTNIATWIGTFAFIEIFKDGNTYDSGHIAMMLSSIIFFQLFFMSVGMLVSVSTKKIRSVLSYSMALSFGMYMLNAVRSIIGGELLGVLTPFYHFEAGYIIEHGSYDWALASISIGIILGGFITTYILYNRRNIHSL